MPYYLVPWEGRKTYYIYYDDADRYEVFEYRFHPFFYLQTFACIGFFKELIPSPAFFITAEQRDYKGTERKQVRAYYEIPEIKPCTVFRERMEWKYAVSQSCSKWDKEDPYTAYKASFFAAPAC